MMNRRLRGSPRIPLKQTADSHPLFASLTCHQSLFIYVHQCFYAFYLPMPSANLLPDERHRIIRRRLSLGERVLAVEMARELGASEDTIRRDLRELASLGLCQRVYGGALPVSPASGSFRTRQSQKLASKVALGRAAAAIVASDQVIFMDAGTTNLEIARALPNDTKFTAATNSPVIAIELISRANITLVMIGGLVDPSAGAALGTRAIRDVQSICIDLTFLGGCAVSDQAGVRAFIFDDAEFKQALVGASRTVALAATTEKLGTTAPFHVAFSSDLDLLIVEADAPAGQLEAFRRSGVRIHQLAD
jgi:DeoR/GlpR family transcriptional regulator of sugar metabolism